MSVQCPLAPLPPPGERWLPGADGRSALAFDQGLPPSPSHARAPRRSVSGSVRARIRRDRQYGQHQATMRRGGVGPGISQRFEACSLLGDRPRRSRRSRVDLANRSSRVTTNTSPFARTAIRRINCLRSDRAPLKAIAVRAQSARLATLPGWRHSHQRPQQMLVLSLTTISSSRQECTPFCWM